MREVAFIKQNKNQWLTFEKKLNSTSASSEELHQLFDKLTTDLAYAQTYYPKSKLVIYLNALTTNAYHKIYKKNTFLKDITSLWTHDVPLIMYRNRKFFYLSIAFFLLSVGLGVLGTYFDENFVRSILGDEYVNNTLQNIKNGDPTAVYNNESLSEDIFSAVTITANNLWVGLQCFFYGILGGIGTLRILFQNGVMVGAFQSMFAQEGVLLQSVKAIWIHGSMEIFAATIEGGAGIMLGTSFLFPGNLTRKQSLLVKGKQALMVVISTFPFTISAGLLEGFITQYANELPIVIDFIIIIVSLSCIVFYYLVFPFLVARKQVESSKFFAEITDEK